MCEKWQQNLCYTLYDEKETTQKVRERIHEHNQRTILIRSTIKENDNMVKTWKFNLLYPSTEHTKCYNRYMILDGKTEHEMN